MKISILKGLSDEAKVEVRGAFKGSLAFRNQLIKVLEEKIESTRKGSILNDSYNSPNWALKQADSVGYERALRECMSLLTEK
jgi:hypothetical protein